jgi:hypothetical protein
LIPNQDPKVLRYERHLVIEHALSFRLRGEKHLLAVKDRDKQYPPVRCESSEDLMKAACISAQLADVLAEFRSMALAPLLNTRLALRRVALVEAPIGGECLNAKVATIPVRYSLALLGGVTLPNELKREILPLVRVPRRVEG